MGMARYCRELGRLVLVGCTVVGAAGCEREAPRNDESPRQVAQAVTSDAGVDSGTPVTPTACVVSLGTLQLGDNDIIQANIAASTISLGSGAKITGAGYSSGNVSVGNQSSMTGTLTYAGQLTEGSNDSFGALVHTAVATPPSGPNRLRSVRAM